MDSKPKARRIFELDLIRGFFIIVIILDHMQRWPSPFLYITGEGRLWVSAAEGFFIISGLLIGYLRAYKESYKPLISVAKKLWKRAAMLWLWSIIITFVVVSLTVLLPGDGALLPKLPPSEVVVSLPVYIWSVVSQQYANDWIYFLRMYAIVLAATPVFLWLLRKGLWSVAFLISFVGFVGADVFDIPDPALQWQFLFFGAALLGWKFEAILAWFAHRPKLRYIFLVSLMTATLATMTLSFFFVHGWKVVEAPQGFMNREDYLAIRQVIDPLFTIAPFTIWRALLAFLWFGGLLSLFHIVKRPLQAAFGWLLMEFGQYSLTAYCLQAVLLCFAVAYIPVSESLFTNFIVSCLLLVGFWGVMKIPLVKKILPQ
jgi:hypothetical protein